MGAATTLKPAPIEVTAVNTPDHTVTFALGAFGQLLVQRHRLAMRLQASLEPDQAVWSNQAFVLFTVERPDPAGQEITAAQLEHPSAVALLERAGAIKALATLLRFAYLADAAVRCVWLLASTTVHSVSAPRLQASFSDSQVVELRLAGEADGRLMARRMARRTAVSQWRLSPSDHSLPLATGVW